MDIIELLAKNQTEMIEKANKILERSALKHYQASGSAENKQRLELLYEYALESIKTKNLIPLTDYIQEVAGKRFKAGFSVVEVHTAINVLEECLWELISKELPPAQLAEGLGMVSRVLGAAKTTLANTYVSLATKGKASSIDVSALFKGTEGE